MVVDTSAVVAILFGEPEAERFAALIEQDRVRLMSAVSAFEASIVIASELGEAGLSELDLLLLRIGMVVEPFGVDQLSWARAAYLQFGKGRHPAGLNFGDCFAYALSRVRNQPLLFKGDDFARTDVRAVRGGQPEQHGLAEQADRPRCIRSRASIQYPASAYTEAAMPLYIRDERIKALAEEVARLQGTTMTEAVRASLAETKRRIEADRGERRARADAALAEFHRMLAERGEPLDENILYDEQGNPIL